MMLQVMGMDKETMAQLSRQGMEHRLVMVHKARTRRHKLAMDNNNLKLMAMILQVFIILII